jgi:hypothetical protein
MIVIYQMSIQLADLGLRGRPTNKKILDVGDVIVTSIQRCILPDIVYSDLCMILTRICITILKGHPNGDVTYT